MFKESTKKDPRSDEVRLAELKAKMKRKNDEIQELERRIARKQKMEEDRKKMEIIQGNLVELIKNKEVFHPLLGEFLKYPLPEMPLPHTQKNAVYKCYSCFRICTFTLIGNDSYRCCHCKEITPIIYYMRVSAYAAAYMAIHSKQ
jgi:hypothetical protein